MRAFVRQIDTKLTDSILSLPMSLQPFFLLVTTLGHPVVPIAIGVIVVVVGLVQANMRLAVSGGAIWITLGVGSLLKLAFGRARPQTEYAANIWLDRLSFPSGHTTGSTIAYGLLAYFAWQLLPHPWNYVVAIIFVILIILIGISRIYLGAHFPSDVIAGWLLGGVALGLVILFIRPLA
ncbi:MAG: Phosphoesterase PA-phosphatase related protein [Candidatus Saccharibacteria bacterium]|nr:Phosphoesterase PA-phosphatase related protein [Candidatus Saccharibacteria bacterium]